LRVERNLGLDRKLGLDHFIGDFVKEYGFERRQRRYRRLVFSHSPHRGPDFAGQDSRLAGGGFPGDLRRLEPVKPARVLGRRAGAFLAL
jgi:hypothetical protein